MSQVWVGSTKIYEGDDHIKARRIYDKLLRMKLTEDLSRAEFSLTYQGAMSEHTERTTD